MKEKWTPHIIAATALVVFIVLGLACASMPQGGPQIVKAFEMRQMPATEILQGKKAVVFDLAFAEKILPRRTEGGSSSGLVGMAMKASADKASLNNFNEAASSNKQIELEKAAMASKQTRLNKTFGMNYAEMTGAETVHATFDFNGATPALDYFSKANAGIKSKIVAACEENKTDFAITMVNQIAYAEALNISAGGSFVHTVVNVEVCLFDKTGVLTALGIIQTINGIQKFDMGTRVYSSLLDDAIENIVLMLPALNGNGDKTVTKELKPLTEDTGDKREAGPDEIVLIVKRNTGLFGAAVPLEVTLDKGTDDERMIAIGRQGQEIRMVVPNGEHTLAADFPGGNLKKETEPFSFTASSANLTYTVGIKSDDTFTWTKVDK
jgi:hypothetical protein